MENATRALIMAASVLIGIIILTLGVTMKNMFSDKAKQYNKTVSSIEIQKYNANFSSYLGRTNITSYEIVSVVNKAKEYKNLTAVKVYINDADISSRIRENVEGFLAENQDRHFSCVLTSLHTPIQYDEKGRIISVTFKEVED